MIPALMVHVKFKELKKMSYKVFCPKEQNILENMMFFDDSCPNIARYDIQKHPIFERLIDKHHSYFWRPEEVELSKDRIDFKNLDEHMKFVFVSNLSYQILLDSVQGRAPNVAFLPFVTDPTLETYIVTWAFDETIHSRSYTHILRNVLAQPGLVFDDILKNTKIMERAASVTESYDDLISYGQIYQVHGEGDVTVGDKVINVTLRELKKKLLITMVSVNILEGVRFYVSFACSFAFKELGQMEGNAKIIKLIARDEALHLAGTQNIINKWRKGEDDLEMQEIFEEITPQIYKMYDDALIQEKEWAEYLFGNGSMLGLNTKILSDYVEYITNSRMRSIGLKQHYNQKKDPIPWMQAHLSSDSIQTAAQETEIESYVSAGGIRIGTPNGANFANKFKF